MLTTIATAATTVADRWDGDRPDFWPIFPIMWFLIIIGGIVAAVVISRRNRDAAGEIDEEEYAARLAVLRRR